MKPSAAVQLADDIREALKIRNAQHETEFFLQLDEAEAIDLASGLVPLSVRVRLRAMVEWLDEDRREAEAAAPRGKRKAG